MDYYDLWDVIWFEEVDPIDRFEGRWDRGQLHDGCFVLALVADLDFEGDSAAMIFLSLSVEI